MNGSLMNLEEFTTLGDEYSRMVQLCLDPHARHGAIRNALTDIGKQEPRNKDRAAHWLLCALGAEILQPFSRSRLDAKYRERAKECADMSDSLELLYAQLRFAVIEQFTQRSNAALSPDLQNRYQYVLNERARPMLDRLLSQQ